MDKIKLRTSLRKVLFNVPGNKNLLQYHSTWIMLYVNAIKVAISIPTVPLPCTKIIARIRLISASNMALF